MPLAVVGMLCLLLLWGSPSLGANDAPLWTDVPEAGIARSASVRQIVPERYRTVRLDLTRFSDQMTRVPQEHSVSAHQSDVELALPMPDGSLARFSIAESPIMAPELAKKFPEIRTWVGQGIDDPSATLRFDLTPKGFHAQVLSADGTIYIDPFQPDDVEHYISYRKHDHHHGKQARCEVTGEELSKESLAEHMKHVGAKVSSGANLRTYRLAVAATGEYTMFHGGTVADGLAGIVTTMNRVNGIYEREVSVRMVLVADNDKIIFTNPATDPYANTSGDLGANQTTINNLIGSANYDVGHLVGTGGGGVASLGVICTTSKARGLTGSPAPIGDAFDVDYVAHEIGHQFGGNHTFNGSGGNCSGVNRNGSTAYEPGSGVSIQAYAGICSADNLQSNSEDFFHRISLNEIIAHTTTGSGGNCGVLTATGNAVPTVSTVVQYQIPANTPFELEAIGDDADSDTLTYAWEQFDLGAANAAGSLVDNGTRALFRAFAPTRERVRIFPSLRYILNNANVPPATAPLPGTNAPNFFTGELLPTATRDLKFRVTVRDNRAGGGGTNEAQTTLKVNSTAGPFAITAPNTAVTWAAGSTQTVTWNVASTDAAPINTAQVQILLSLDGGYTWPTTLAADADNNGTASVTIPAGTPSTSNARIKVKAVDNVFFDISNTNFTITGNNTPPSINVTGSINTRQGSPAITAPVATVSDVQDAAGALTITVAEAPDELAVVPANANGTIELTVAAACTLVAPTSGTRTYPVRLDVTDLDDATSTAWANVILAANQAPSLGSYAGLAVARNTITPIAPSAPASDPNGNFSSITATPSTLPGGGSVAVALDGTVTVTTTAGTTYGSYPVQVHVVDTCGATTIREFTLQVAPAEAILAVDATSVLSGNGLIEPGECNDFSLSLTNVGTVTATGVSATLSTSTPNASLTQAVAAFPDIPAGESRTSTTPFQISTETDLVCYSTIALDVEVQYAGGDGPLLDTVILDVGQPAATNYAFTASTGATLPTGGTRITGSNVDDALVSVTVPFAFSLYSNNYPANTTLRASTNGTLQFVASGGSIAYDNAALPSTGTQSGNSFPVSAPTIMPFWDDLRLDTSDGGIYTYLEGTAPNRSFTIVWRGQPYSNTVGATNTQVGMVLHENSSAFDFVYGATAAGTGSSGGASATIGLQAGSSSGTYTQYSFNTVSVSPGTRLSATLPPAVCTIGDGGCSGSGGADIFKDGFESDPVLRAAPVR